MKLCRFCAEEIQEAAIVCKHCGRTLTADRPAVVLRGAELAIGFLAFCFVASLLFMGLGGAPGLAERFPALGKLAGAFLAPGPASAAPAPRPSLPPPPLVIPVLDAPELRLPAGEHFDTAFVVSDPHGRACTFHGHVQGMEGGDRDVEVYLLDEDGHTNWHNGIRPAPLYESGRSSATTIQLPVRNGGRLHLLISNRYSVFTAKTVQVDDARVVCE